MSGGLVFHLSQQVVEYVLIALQLQAAIGVFEQGVGALVVEDVERALGVNVEALGQQVGYATLLAPKYLVSHPWPPFSVTASVPTKRRQWSTMA